MFQIIQDISSKNLKNSIINVSLLWNKCNFKRMISYAAAFGTCVNVFLLYIYAGAPFYVSIFDVVFYRIIWRRRHDLANDVIYVTKG